MNLARDVISAEPRATWPAHVEVDARERWCHTGIFLEARVLYRFAVPENQTWTDWILVSGPQGRTHFTTSLFRRWLRVQKSHGQRAEFFTLIGTIGESTEQSFIIGAGTTHSVAQSGELICFANDVDTWLAYRNNSGHMRLEISLEKL